MFNVRRYGTSPFSVALLHGGPGAAGEMAPVARQLSAGRGILEPLQTSFSLQGQVHELEILLEAHADLPATLVGFSWGAWLACLLAAHRPELVRGLVLVSAGPFEAHWAERIEATRKERMNPDERRELSRLLGELEDSGGRDRAGTFRRFGTLFSRIDAWDPLPQESDPDSLEMDPEIFRRVWAEAAALRESGELLERCSLIRCPVVAIHGDFDPHPAEGVKEPLSRILPDFRFHLLDRCGHRPWTEREAREPFFHILEEELGRP